MILAYAAGAAFLAGLTSSLGPCLAPRYVLVAAQISAGASAYELAVFLSGCCAGYLVFSFVGVTLAAFELGSHVIYALLAIALIVYGLVSLACAPRTCSHLKVRRAPGSLGGRFLLGVSCTLLGSPCCAPIALAIGLQAEQQDAMSAATTLVAFGAGHAAPIVASMFATASRRFQNVSFPFGAAPTISGTLLTAMGALYAVLA